MNILQQFKYWQAYIFYMDSFTFLFNKYFIGKCVSYFFLLCTTVAQQPTPILTLLCIFPLFQSVKKVGNTGIQSLNFHDSLNVRVCSILNLSTTKILISIGLLSTKFSMIYIHDSQD